MLVGTDNSICTGKIQWRIFQFTSISSTVFNHLLKNEDGTPEETFEADQPIQQPVTSHQNEPVRSRA